MKKTTLIWKSIIMITLMIMLPACFADELNLIYDANGNLVSGDGKYREYNSLNQLVKIYNGSDENGLLLETLQYHPMEERVLVKEDHINNETTYYIDENFVQVENSSGNYTFTYVKHEGQLIAQKNPDSSKIYIHPDHLGSSTTITNEAGQAIENTTYAPFGSVVEGGTATRYGYEGKEHDSLVGDTDFHFRKYKSDWGIFIQPDTIIADAYDPPNLNRYSFENNNPYNNVDEDGHIATFIAGVLFSMMIGILVSFVIQQVQHGEIDDNKMLASAGTSAVLGAVGGTGDMSTGQEIVTDIATSTYTEVVLDDDGEEYICPTCEKRVLHDKEGNIIGEYIYDYGEESSVPEPTSSFMSVQDGRWTRGPNNHVNSKPLDKETESGLRRRGIRSGTSFSRVKTTAGLSMSMSSKFAAKAKKAGYA